MNQETIIKIFKFLKNTENQPYPLKRVEKNGKWNFIDITGKILSKEWFDKAWSFSRGFAEIKKNGKENFIDINGNLLFFKNV